MGGFTSTSFGLLIAYLLPGIIVLYGVSLWSPRVHAIFQTFLGANSNAGLFLLLLLASLIAGLLVSGVRVLTVDIGLQLLFKEQRLLFQLRIHKWILFRGVKCPQLETNSGPD